MKTKEGYSGIDIFRIISALLVIAIHTSPLQSMNGTADFMLTRVIARVAVPFFFLTSGFFLISRYARNTDPLKEFVCRTAILYGIATLLYFPVTLYNRSFRLGWELIKDIVFDGTFYHLWYFSAAMTGACIAWFLVRRWDYRAAIPVTAFLYLIGLFGDSYYGITMKFPLLSGFYQVLFQFFDHTRNGIFLAPLFFVLGGFCADHGDRIIEPADGTGKKKPMEKVRSVRIIAIAGMAAFFFLLSMEALALRYFNLQRHDSMYLFLPGTVFFLFILILTWRGQRHNGFSAIARNVYIIHPMMILVVRLAAKLMGSKFPFVQLYISGMGWLSFLPSSRYDFGTRWLSFVGAEKLMIENSIVHFILVALLSFAAACFLYKIEETLRQRKPLGKRCGKYGRGAVGVNLEHLGRNMEELRRILPGKCRIMAVVKGNAYGHGEYEVATCLDKMGIEAYAVATIDEGIRLRKYGIRGEILILGYTDPIRAKEIRKYHLIQTVIDHAYGKTLESQGIPVKVHIKIDTGMHRLGIDWRAVSEVEEIYKSRKLSVCGIFTHLCCADSLREEDVAFTKQQIARFEGVISELRKAGIEPKGIHIQSSYGVLNYPELSCDYARIGILLFGVDSMAGMKTVLRPDLEPVLSLESKVVLLRSVPAGETVGYDRLFVAGRDTKVAVIPIGYRDGIPRALSLGKGGVLIKGQMAPIIGRVCMDQLMVDVTEIENVVVGDRAAFISSDRESVLSAPAVAEMAGSISNELLSRLGERVPRRQVP